jgi:hypothetical protein
MISGKHVVDSEAAMRPGPLVNDREYAVTIKVQMRTKEDADIAVELDGKPYIHWRGPASSLAPYEGWVMTEPRCPGVGAWESLATFRRARIRAVSGDVKPLRESVPPVSAPAKGRPKG